MEASRGHGPTVERALLTAELRRLRHATGQTQQDVAKSREWSLSKFTRVENGTSPVTKTDLESLLRYYGLHDEGRIRELTDRARAARQPGWWEEFELDDDKAFRDYIGYEYGASSIRATHSLVVPGLLQTPEYTKDILEEFLIPQEAIQKVIDFRLERQRQVAAQAPTQTYVLDEAILTRQAGDPMITQLRHLLELADDPAVTIQVIPRRHHFGLLGPFTLLGFDVPLGQILYIENIRQGDLLVSEAGTNTPDDGHQAESTEASDTLAAYAEGFKRLQEIALEPEESVKRIGDIARELS